VAHKILIVDDNPSVRRAIRSSIEQRGEWIVVGEAENGKIAVLMVGTHKPHLVILDLSMPVMNGIDAAREISKISPGIPMIMFTLHAHDALHEVARSVGIKYVFSKAEGMGERVFDAMRKLLPT
jgi:two-component system, chemotaxis family, chemotaxis protein CheY